jgi:hypothetical protein
MQIAGVPTGPLSYIGPNMNLIPIKVFKREPATTDVKYRIGTFIIIGKDPVSGTEGDLWYLSDFNATGEAVWLQILTGAASPGIDSITTDSGIVEPDGVGNINIVSGVACSVTGDVPGNTVTINFTGQVITWSVITTATKTIVNNEGYFANRAGGVIFTLPATSIVGDRIKINAKHANGWKIYQNAFQKIRLGNQITTTGVSGSLESTDIGDSVELVCSEANIEYNVISSIGNITIK